MTSLTGEWLLQAELEEMARRPYKPPVTDPPGVPPLKSPRPTPEYPGGVPRDPPPITPPVKTAGLPAGGWQIPGQKTTGFGSMKPGDVERLKQGNPGASDKIDKEVQQIRQGINLPLAQNKKRDPLQELRDGLIDRDTFEKLRKTSPHLFEDTEEEGPVDISDWLVELNPAQIKVLEKLKGVDKLPDAERLQRMREITDEVNKAKGLA